MTLQVAVGGGGAHAVALTRSRTAAVVFIDRSASPTTCVFEGSATVIDMEGLRETLWCAANRDTVFVHVFGRAWTVTVTDPAESSMRAGQICDAATAPMPGVLVSIAVQAGDQVSRDQVVAVIESMKMHSEILAPRDGVVDRVLVGVGENFDQGAALVALVPADPANGQED